jgi:hypothetical protein
MIPIASRIPSDRLCFMFSSACSYAASQSLWLICSRSAVRLVFVSWLKLLQEVSCKFAWKFHHGSLPNRTTVYKYVTNCCRNQFLLFYFSFQYELRYVTYKHSLQVPNLCFFIVLTSWGHIFRHTADLLWAVGMFAEYFLSVLIGSEDNRVAPTAYLHCAI